MTTHPIIKTLTDKITSELRPVDREAAFDAMLDDCYSFKAVGGPFMYMQPSAVLKEMDPTAYRCGVNDFEDGEAWVEIEGETYDQREVEELVAEFREELESELSDLESELEELTGENGAPITEEELELEQKIKDKQAEIDAIAAEDFYN